MFDAIDRRRAIVRAGGLGSALAMLASGGRDAAAEEPRETGAAANHDRRVETMWHGGLDSPTYQRHPDGEAGHYLITALGAGKGKMRHMKRGTTNRMSDQRLADYLQKKSGGEMAGQVVMRLQEINWRVMGTEYDGASNTWRIDAVLCESNPDVVPAAVTTADVHTALDYYSTEACICGCDENCYHCGEDATPWRRNKYYCGEYYGAACK